jgi:osmoprotectant transport system permease protein
MFEFFIRIYEFIAKYPDKYFLALNQHITIAVTVLVISILVGLPMGAIAAKNPSASGWIINIFNTFKMIPSMALLMLSIPIIGVGFAPAVIAITAHALPTLIINTYTGYKEIDGAVLESAAAMGLRKREIFLKVETPLAFPIIISGLRICVIDVISSATLATIIGAGGLGKFITGGMSNFDMPQMFAGSLTVTALSLILDAILVILKKVLIRYKSV